MKKSLIIAVLYTFAASSLMLGQIDLGKVLKKSKKDAEKSVEKRIENKIKKGVDNTLDETEKTLSGSGEKKDKADKKESTTGKAEGGTKAGAQKTDNTPQEKAAPAQFVWNKYDFVPGDIVIFEDNLSGEKNGEFPSKWDVTKGTVENANLNGENVICFIKCNTNGGGGIVPFLKNSNTDYLPEEFTIEFDAYFEKPNASYQLYLLDMKDQQKLDPSVNYNKKYLRWNQNSAGGSGVETSFYPNTSATTNSLPGWRHIAVSFNKRALKSYIDDSRTLNVPNLGYNPTGVTIGFHNPSGKAKGYIKDFRIAKGAVPLYDKVLSEGKIVTTGIKFDVNKAVIKPESMGVMNEIFKIMQDNPSIKFSVEGHTDSDGDDASNQKLSEARAQSVKVKLIEMGIASDRLKSAGWGESKPVADNNTPEGKANNRRVEFVKF